MTDRQQRIPFYKSVAWQNTRRAYAQSKDYLCERCLEEGRQVYGEIVHHRIHLTAENVSDPQIALGWDNLQLLCRNCHAEVHSDKPRARYKVDELGRVEIV